MALNLENILLVDDDVHILELLQRHLQTLNYHTYKAVSVKEAIAILQDKTIDLLITDLKMPGVDGLELVKYVSEHFPSMPKLVVTGYPSIDGALEVMKSGVTEYVTKPFTKEELKTAVKKALDSRPKSLSNSQANTVSSTESSGLIGQSDAIKKVIDIINRVKNNKATVFITGESGTGKELVARSIHYSGKFSKAPFIAVNCGAIPENLLESELFGYAKGAFTGAEANRDGFFQAAQQGTIFLDEIGNASLATQARLLRVLQEKEVTRVGSQKVEPVDVRVVAATNVNLKELIAKGTFREDLYYRLTVVEVAVPPLKERKEDIALLANKFLQKYAVEFKDTRMAMAPGVIEALERYDWPGNIRELENVIQRAVIMSDKEVTIADLPDQLKYHIEFPEVEEAFLPLKTVEKEYILKVLQATNNNKSKAAKILQIDRKTLSEKIK
ncbi:sigma-54-dependent transcriptional regulator [Bizionia sediminis]|uniref:Sigma-54-dependent transcriptional regulator n=1 Tax=Bizionia sediminis TaxID=1737064 RepID=A0ABW5KVD4_9FLAO